MTFILKTKKNDWIDFGVGPGFQTFCNSLDIFNTISENILLLKLIDRRDNNTYAVLFSCLFFFINFLK